MVEYKNSCDQAPFDSATLSLCRRQNHPTSVSSGNCGLVLCGSEWDSGAISFCLDSKGDNCYGFFHLTKLMVYPIILSAPTKKIDSTSVGFFQSVLDLQRIFMTTRERVVTWAHANCRPQQKANRMPAVYALVKPRPLASPYLSINRMNLSQASGLVMT